MEKQLTNARELSKTFGQHAKKINQRISELKAAGSLAVMRFIPATRCHELSGARKGELAVNVSPNYRMIFEPNHSPLPKKEDAGLEWERITKVQINQIEDYH